MATIEEGLVSFIEANVASAGKGYPLVVPQDAAYPAWSYMISETQDLTMDGATGWFVARVSIQFIHTSYSLARGSADALRAALDGYRGTMGTRSVQYCHVSEIASSWSDAHDMPGVNMSLVIDYV